MTDHMEIVGYMTDEGVGLKHLAREYRDDHDPITVRAMEYFGVTYNKVTPAMRRAVHQRGSEGCRAVIDDLSRFKPHGWHRADM